MTHFFLSIFRPRNAYISRTYYICLSILSICALLFSIIRHDMTQSTNIVDRIIAVSILLVMFGSIALMRGLHLYSIDDNAEVVAVEKSRRHTMYDRSIDDASRFVTLESFDRMIQFSSKTSFSKENIEDMIRNDQTHWKVSLYERYDSESIHAICRFNHDLTTKFATKYAEENSEWAYYSIDRVDLVKANVTYNWFGHSYLKDAQVVELRMSAKLSDSMRMTLMTKEALRALLTINE